MRSKASAAGYVLTENANGPKGQSGLRGGARMPAMTEDYYDALEHRDPAARERDNLARLPDVIARARSAPGWARQLAGVDPKTVTSRTALAKLPLLRKSDLLARQKAFPPFGGFAVT